MCIMCASELFSPIAGNSLIAQSAATVVASGDAEIDGLLIGTKWLESTVTYAFPTVNTGFTTPYEIAPGTFDTGYVFGFVAVSSNFADATSGIFQDIDAMTGLSFSQSATADADIVVARTTDSDLPTASGRFPGYSANQGHQWYANHVYEQSPTVGSYTWHTILHETGHTLGLAHAHSADSISGTLSGQVQPADRDSMEFTVMSYRPYDGAPLTGYTNETYGFAQSLMMDDIAALHYLYGADYGADAGDTTYTFSATTGEMFVDGVGQGTPGANRIFRTLWDGNGNDTYDLSNYSTPLDIDLTPGRWSTFSDAQRANLGNGNQARANLYNAKIVGEDTRSLIENAIGGSSDDTLIGNLGDDRMLGGAGDDLMVWNNGDGSDFIDGGDDDDRMQVNFQQSSDLSNLDMLITTLIGLGEKYNLSGEHIDDVVGGAVVTHSKDWNLAREAVVGSDLAPTTPGTTMMQACGTSLQAAMGIASKIATGEIESGIAMGSDTTSDAPIVFSKKFSKRLMDMTQRKGTWSKIGAFKGLSARELPQ